VTALISTFMEESGVGGPLLLLT